MRIYKVKKTYGDIETHEVFLDKLAQAKEEELGISEKKFEVPLKEAISYALFGGFLILAGILFSKTAYLQVAQGKQILVEAENNKGSINIIIPERGIIYDKNFTQLVINSPAYDLVCDKMRFYADSPEITGEIELIAGIFSKNPEEISALARNSNSAQFVISENISHENLLVLETKIDLLAGCKIVQNTKRKYVLGDYFSQILGYTGRINKDEYSQSNGYTINDFIGKTGLEKYYENYLRGKSGQSRPQKSFGAGSSQILKSPEAGNNLVLHIDSNLQKKAYDALEKSIKRVGAKKGSAVAIDPRSGAVLALVSYPSYDSNLFSDGISFEDYDKLQNDPYQPLFNRAISARYPTGSTIKPFEASAALQENIISPTKLIDDPGYILVHSKYDPAVVYKYGGVTPHGLVDMRKALAVSSNIYFYTIGGGYKDQQGLGPNKIKKYLSLFGWGQKTGVDLPGEFSGFIPDPEWKKKAKGQSWWDGDTYNLSIGQSDLQVTPLQVAVAYCAIANGGTLYKPQIVSKVVKGSGALASVVQEFAPQVIRSNFIDPENLEVVRQGMRDGVAKPYGGSALLNDLPVKAASKTGTAEIGYANRFNVWSSVFAPYDNPEIVLTVTVENVEGLGAVTLPVAHDVLNWYFSK